MTLIGLLSYFTTCCCYEGQSNEPTPTFIHCQEVDFYPSVSIEPTLTTEHGNQTTELIKITNITPCKNFPYELSQIWRSLPENGLQERFSVTLKLLTKRK